MLTLDNIELDAKKELKNLTSNSLPSGSAEHRKKDRAKRIASYRVELDLIERLRRTGRFNGEINLGNKVYFMVINIVDGGRSTHSQLFYCSLKDLIGISKDKLVSTYTNHAELKVRSGSKIISINVSENINSQNSNYFRNHTTIYYRNTNSDCHKPLYAILPSGRMNPSTDYYQNYKIINEETFNRYLDLADLYLEEQRVIASNIQMTLEVLAEENNIRWKQ